MIDYSKFRSSLKRLEEQNGNYRQGNPALSDLDREGIAESVLRRFKTCYDCLWKVLKRYLTEALAVADTPNSPKPVFRLAHENNLFAAPLMAGFYPSAEEDVRDTAPRSLQMRKASRGHHP